MIKLSRLADYAVVLMAHYVHGQDILLSAHELAIRTRLPQATVSKVLKSLAKANLLASEKGIKGGYRLARPADKIPVAEIIMAVDGPIGVTECVDGHVGECNLESWCPTRLGFNRINGAIRKALTEVSLAEILAPPPLPPRQEIRPEM